MNRSHHWRPIGLPLNPVECGILAPGPRGARRLADHYHCPDYPNPPRQAGGTAGPVGPASEPAGEQKTAKLIALLEELRRDLPELTNRHAAEAAAMEQATDPHAILDVLETLHEPVPAEADHEPLEKSDAGDGRSPAGR